ncbi:MAG: hypothetical protein VYA08_02930, partial [Pseudomonadota bacterium]|nr:hypothetical protein [Pseudomonadota bacterium]
FILKLCDLYEIDEKTTSTPTYGKQHYCVPSDPTREPARDCFWLNPRLSAFIGGYGPRLILYSVCQQI